MTEQGIKPPLSIGLPVYNGENFLASALDSLLGQTFVDFELIVCDNASTDGTAEICRVFAANDARIRYHRNERNIGAAGNYNQALALARGHYFKWAAHDDICHPRFLEACIEVLDGRPDVVLCHSRSEGIGDRGEVKGYYGQERAFDAESPTQRFWQAISTPHVCIAVFGVMRREVLLKTIRHGNWVGADRNLLAELCLHGKIALVPEFLFQRREHAEASIHKFEDEDERLAWFDPDRSGRRSFPTWRRVHEYRRAIGKAPLSAGERLACYAQLPRWLLARHHTGPRNIGQMAREVMRAFSRPKPRHGGTRT